MFFPGNSHDHQSPQNDISSTRREDGSYEVVFDSTTPNTEYKPDGYNAYGFSPNGSSKQPSEQPPKEEVRSQTSAPAVMLILASLLAALSLVISLGTFMMLKNNAPNFTVGTKPQTNQTLEPWTNPFDTVPTDAYAAATAKTINSVVVIDVTSQSSSGSGSGVVWAVGNNFSYIVTCNHVIEGGESILVTFNNGEKIHAELVGGDSRTDVAVLKIDRTDVPPILLPSSESSLAIGQAVIAIGNPLGELGNSVSDGILSSTARSVLIDGSEMRLLQTTAAVNHGNSGGGLFDLSGQLVGLVNAKISETSVEGIGFAIPYDVLKTVAAEIIEKGYVSGRPSLGITTVMIDTTASLNDALRQYPDLENYVYTRNFFGQQAVAGLYVVDPSTGAGYGAESTALEFGDRITQIGSVVISSSADVKTALNGYAAGDTVQITFIRGNKSYITEIVLDEIGK